MLGVNLMQLFPTAVGPLQLQRPGQHRVLRLDHSTLLSVPAGSNPALLSFGEGAAPNVVLSRRCGGGDAEPQPLQMGASPTDGITSARVLLWPIRSGSESHHHLLPVLSVIPRLQSPQAHLFSH